MSSATHNVVGITRHTMNFDEWCYESDIERKWQNLQDEYGDLVPLLSEYLGCLH